MLEDGEGFNAYEDCACCGHCCELTVLAATHDEVQLILKYVTEHDIEARDQGPWVCPFRNDDKTCAIYPVRTQTCRLHNCRVPRKRLLAEHPEIYVDDDKPLIDMRRAFLHGDFRDAREIYATAG